MYKHPQNAILPLSIAVPISQQGTQIGYGDKNKGKQHSPIYSKIIKQPQKKDKERQKVKENNTNISIKTMEQSLQNVRPILQKKQSNKELLTVPQKNRTINYTTQCTKLNKNQSIRTNIHNNKGFNDKKTKNTYSNLKSLNNSKSLGKIKPSNTLNPIVSTQMKPKDEQNKNKSIGNSNFSKYGKFEKFIKQTNKNIQKYNEKEDKQPEPVIDIKIHVQNRQNDRQRQIKNHSFINSLQQPTKFLQESIKNSPQPSNYQSKKIHISENRGQNLNKKYNSQNKLKKYNYLSLIPTQIVHDIDKNMINKDSIQKESVKYNSRRKSIKNNYQNFRIKRSQQNSVNQLSQINSFNECNLYKNLQQASLNKQHYINPAHRLHSHGSTLRLRSISGGKSVSLTKNNGSFVNALGYMDDFGRARSRRRSLESRSKGSIRQQSIQCQVNKLQNRCKKMLNNLQTPKEGYRHKYNYLEQVEFQREKDRQKQRLKQKQRQLIQRQRKLIQKQRDIQRRKRKQIVLIQNQRQVDRDRQRRKERQRQILKINERQRDYQMNNEKRRRLQEKQRIQRDLQIRKTLQMQKQIQRQKKRELQKQQQLKRVQIKSKRQIYSNISSPLKGELCNSVHNNPNKYQTITQTNNSIHNYNLHQSQNYKPYQQNTQKRTFVYPIQSINTSTNKTHNNLTTPYRNTAESNSKQAYQSPIDKINATSARPNIRQKQTCACMHDCQCNDITGQLNTSRINRINNKLEQYIARNMKSGRDTFEHHPHYH